MPNAIDKMLGNYKKVATKSLNIVCPGSKGHFKKRIATNLNFTPTMVFVIMDNGLTMSPNVFCSTGSKVYDGYSLNGKVTAITNDYVDVDILIDYPYHE